MENGRIALAALLVSGTAAYGQQAPVTVSLEGAYILEGDSIGHKHFGPAVFASEPDSEHQDGASGAIGFRYHFPTYFVGLKVDYAKIDRGVPFSVGVPAEMGIESMVVDAEYGRPFALGANDAVWTAAIRYADMEFSTDNFGPNSGPLHSFTGIGVRAGVETDFALPQQGLNLTAAGGLSILDGEIETTSRGIWVCIDCVETDTTTVGVDLKLGLEFQQNEQATWVVGYQAKYWSKVNVGYSDNTFVGGNQGTSDILLHGPFIGLNVALQ